MTPVDHLADAWQRHRWANQAGEAFQSRCVEFTSADPYLIYAEWNAECWEVSFRGPRDPAREAENLTELSRLLGAFLRPCSRGAELRRVSAGPSGGPSEPLPDRSDDTGSTASNSIPSDFPIYNSATLYRRDNRLKKLPAKYVELIESVQPYNGGHDPLGGSTRSRANSDIASFIRR